MWQKRKKIFFLNVWLSASTCDVKKKINKHLQIQHAYNYTYKTHMLTSLFVISRHAQINVHFEEANDFGEANDLRYPCFSTTTNSSLWNRFPDKCHFKVPESR